MSRRNNLLAQNTPPAVARAVITLSLLTAYLVVAAVSLGQWQLAAWFGVGLVVGLGLFWADDWGAYRWYQDQDWLPSTPPTLITRSMVMGGLYLVLAVLMMAALGSLVGMGVVTSLLVSYVVELWAWAKRPRETHQRFFWQIHRHFTDQELQKIRLGYTVLVVVLCLIQLR